MLGRMPSDPAKNGGWGSMNGRLAILAALGFAVSIPSVIAACDTETTLGNTSASSSGGSGGGTTDDGGASSDGDDGGSAPDGGCVYTDNASFCACQKWTCGGFTVQDANGNNQVVYCGQCPNTQYCVPDPAWGPGVGACGGTNPLAYSFQKQKIDMLVSMGENDNTIINYGYAKNIGDGRGYTIGKVGFTTGTGDFIIVAQCYNMAKPGNVLQKYWSALVYINNLLQAGDAGNIGDTSKIDAIGNFVSDVAAAAAEAPPAGQQENAFQICQDSLADADYLSAAAAHLAERGLQGALTAGFLYDTELNFGEADDPSDGGTVGTVTVLGRADKDYGSTLPKSFAGLPWEESKWLGYVIKERTLVMAANSTWKSAIDQNSTWEAARRLNTASTNSPESATKLDMDFDFVSQYQAGAAAPPAPCWTGLPNNPQPGGATVYTVTTDKSAGASKENLWAAAATKNTNQTYVDCPKNPTP
jgi:hypothetical protein